MGAANHPIVRGGLSVPDRGQRPFPRHFEIHSMAFWASLELSEAILESLMWNVAREEGGSEWNVSGSSMVRSGICIPGPWD